MVDILEMFKDVEETSMNEVEYLNELFAIESEEDFNESLRTYYLFEKGTLDYENVTLSFSAENLRDKISFHKSRIMILIKQLISKLIEMVIDFFSIGTTQKKIMLMISKQLDEALKSLNKTLSERLNTKGYFKFEDKNVEIRDTSETILKPVVYLLLIGSVLNLDVTKMIEAQQNRLLNNKNVNASWNTYRVAVNMGLTGDVDKIQSGLIKLGGAYGKIGVILQMFSDKFIPAFTETYLEDVIDTKNLATNHGDDKATAMISLEGFKSVLSGSPDKLSSYYHNLTKALGITDVTDSDIKTNHVIYYNLFQESKFESIFSETTIAQMKETAEETLEGVNSFFESHTDVDTITIDSSSTFFAYCKYVPQSSREMAKLFKSLDYKKEMEKIRKNLTEAQKKINSVNGDLFEVMEGEMNITKFITTVTYQYTTAKSILNKYLRIAIKAVDNGITDLKKVEAAIA